MGKGNIKKRFKWILLTITVLAVGMIFLNSARPASISDEQSKGILVTIVTFLENIGISSNLTNHMIRKSAHFIEYFILGCLLLTTTKAFTPYLKKHIFTALFLGLFIPVCDETIQLFVEGRSGQVQDILLDFSGVVTGFIIIFMIIICVDCYRKKTDQIK